MSHPRPLPESPDLAHLKKQAKRLLAAVRAGDAGARARVGRAACDVAVAGVKLSHCQWTLAREHGFASWRALKSFVDAVHSEGGRLLAAVRGGDAGEVDAVLAAHPELVNACVDREVRALPTDTRAMRLLHVCVAEGRVDVARVLLDRGADPDVRNADGRTPLHDSLELGRRAITELLIARGAEVDVCAAAILGDTARLAAALDADPELAHDRTTGLSPLGWASYGGTPEVARLLAARGVVIDALDGLAPACECDHSRFVAAALELGADPRETFGRARRTALHHAAELRHTLDATASARLLLDAGADPRAADANGVTPLDIAEAGLARGDERRRFAAMVALLRS